MRVSKLGGTVLIVLEFKTEDNSIYLSLRARKGQKEYALEYRAGTVPEGIVVDDVWYNLYFNNQEVQNALEKAEVTEEGPISLGAYIRLKKQAEDNSSLEIIDDAFVALEKHPEKELTFNAPVCLKASLYPYQQQGYQWLRFITDSSCGCILGDEMGLGKTLQVIALITEQKQRGKGPSLVVAPVSLLENWRREIDKFTTGLKVCVHHGSKRTGLYQELLGYDVVIISYNTAVSDQSMLSMINWNLLVVDEAQNIKNPYARRTKYVKKIRCGTAIAVTGTPFENHITDLWSMMDFIVPGSMGSISEFENKFTDDLEGARKLEPYLSPLMLRRKVADVAKDLPERVDIPQILEMSTEESLAYECQRQEILSSFDGKNVSLPMLQKLRMYCTHPMLIDEQQGFDPVVKSSKYERLCELLEEIVSLREKTILFTSYNKMFDILLEDIPKRFGILVTAINGATPVEERQPIIDAFTKTDGSALLVLNPRAAGAGLNITAASRVIHYNLEWNPSLEDQASARAYRRGQDKTVFIYRLYYKDTVEEVINERIEKKRSMFDAAVVGIDGSVENREDIIRALTISPGGKDDG